MKKLSIILVVALVCLTSLFATFDYSLDFISLDPLHKEYIADKNSANIAFGYIHNFSGFPDHIHQDSLIVYPLEYKGQKGMTQIKVGENFSLLRNTFSFDGFISPISFDFSIQAALSFILDDGITDIIAEDGVYFFGLTASVADKVSMRAGFHHYSNHYGDYVYKKMEQSQLLTFDRIQKYLRMMTYVVGVSVEPIDGIRLYGEYNWVPANIDGFRPWMFRPDWLTSEDHTINDPSGKYKARIVNFGLELSHTFFKSLGTTTLACDLHLYEEGQIVYKNEDGSYMTNEADIHYDPTLPWRREISVVLSQELATDFFIEIQYCQGASPINMFYFLNDDAKWLKVSFKYNPNPTVTLIK